MAIALGTVAFAQAQSLTSLTVTPASVVGGNNFTGTLAIDTVAPAGGTPVSIFATGATVPSTVTVPAGKTTATFTGTTQGVAATTTATVAVTCPQ
jgi:hypothetical protein